MDAKPENIWQQQTIPIWISPAYTKSRRTQIGTFLRVIQNATNIRFRSYAKERDVDYISVKIITYGCYGVIGFGRGGERWMNLFEDCLDYAETTLRTIYQVFGFQMIATKNPDKKLLYREFTIGLEFYAYNDVITNSYLHSLNEPSNGTIVIGAESATSMTCHQPNMEINYWTHAYTNLIHSYPYIDLIMFPKYFRNKNVEISEHDRFHLNRIYAEKNMDPIYDLTDSTHAAKYNVEKLLGIPGVFTGVRDLHCEDMLVDCAFMQNNRDHCNLYQEFRFQHLKENELPVCTDDLESVNKGICDPNQRYRCLLPAVQEKCTRSCGYCPEHSQVNCDFIIALNAEYSSDHPSYNYRCQYIRVVPRYKCKADTMIPLNPVTDCMLSCGRASCMKNDIDYNSGYTSIPVMQLYVLPQSLKFPTFGFWRKAEKERETH
ncbi:unnamed protein product [Thelazia callipaeda]|uniref:Peptidase M12A domain-containing protein n=1 Tax=Thelazia callipaeda TaxID=103827 RepID=A0A0N5D4J9_THECL|nr:unnamed protein product [Thelazia callipaeda]